MGSLLQSTFHAQRRQSLEETRDRVIRNWSDDFCQTRVLPVSGIHCIPHPVLDAMDGPPLRWNVIMTRGGFTANDSIVIKEIIDTILDTVLGAIPDEVLRKEMEMQASLFPAFDVYELFIWSFEEGSPNLLCFLREAIVCMAGPSADILLVAKAVQMNINGY